MWSYCWTKVERNALHRVCRLYEAQDEYREQTAGIYYRRPLRILPQSVRSGTREDVPLTHDLSHQMVRLIFVEQLYRAMTILNGGRIIMNDEFQLRDTWNPLSESDISTNLALGFGTFSVKVSRMRRAACGSLATIYR